jgi:ribosomal protein S18 acetylase RimI-like enzyme
MRSRTAAGTRSSPRFPSSADVEASRRADAADLGRIVGLATAMRAELRAMKGGEVWLAREAWAEPLEDSYAALLARDDACVVVGTIDGVVLGFGAVIVETLRSGSHLGVVSDLYVEPGARSVGIGEAMAGDLLTFCAARDCVGVDAFALPGARATKNFFEEQHFTARALLMHRPGPADPTG